MQESWEEGSHGWCHVWHIAPCSWARFWAKFIPGRYVARALNEQRSDEPPAAPVRVSRAISPGWVPSMQPALSAFRRPTAGPGPAAAGKGTLRCTAAAPNTALVLLFSPKMEIVFIFCDASMALSLHISSRCLPLPLINKLYLYFQGTPCRYFQFKNNSVFSPITF